MATCISQCPGCSGSADTDSLLGNVHAVCIQCGDAFLIPLATVFHSTVTPAVPTTAEKIRRSRFLRRLNPRLWGQLISVAVHVGLVFLLSLFCFVAELDEQFVLNGEITGPLEDLNVLAPLRVDASSTIADSPAKDPLAFAAATQTDNAVAVADIGLPAGIGGGASGGDGNGRGLFGGTGNVKSMAYVVDASGSMTGDRMERVLAELAASIRGLRQDQSFFVVFFNERTYPMMWPKIEKRLVWASTFNKNRVINWANLVVPEEATQPQNALRMALELKPELVFFLTDGEIPEGTARTVRLYRNIRTTVHSIGVGKVADNPLMERIARIGRGAFRLAP